VTSRAGVNRLRIMSYNVRYFGHSTRGLASTRTSMRRIARAVAELRPLPAIVCLQEVETRSIRSTLVHRAEREESTQLERFMEMLSAALVEVGAPDAYTAYYFPAHAYRIGANTHAYTTGLAILAHADFAVDHHNAETPHDITHRRLHAIRRFKQTRICAHVRFRERAGTHRTVEIFNTHLSLPSTLTKEFWTKPQRLGWGPNQLEEARNLARFVERERASDRFMVVGDFNSLPGSPVYAYLVEDRGWVDAFALRYRLSVQELTGWPTAGFMRMRMHLDHVFSGAGLRWLDFDDTHPFGDRAAPFHGLSDHVPMVARCRLARGDTLPPR
jgi:endonuclease/exonuclease/phosphatase family metal-dependent hydrolase